MEIQKNKQNEKCTRKDILMLCLFFRVSLEIVFAENTIK